MKRRCALALAAAVFTLGCSTALTHARPSPPRNRPTDPPRQSLPSSAVHTYLAVLNRGMQTGDFSRLASVFAPRATLRQLIIITLTNAPWQDRVVHGLIAITTTYRVMHQAFPESYWTQGTMARLSATAAVCSVEGWRSAHGAAIDSDQHFEIQNGKITSLTWTTYIHGR